VVYNLGQFFVVRGAYIILLLLFPVIPTEIAKYYANRSVFYGKVRINISQTFQTHLPNTLF